MKTQQELEKLKSLYEQRLTQCCSGRCDCSTCADRRSRVKLLTWIIGPGRDLTRTARHGTLASVPLTRNSRKANNLIPPSALAIQPGQWNSPERRRVFFPRLA